MLLISFWHNTKKSYLSEPIFIYAVTSIFNFRLIWTFKIWAVSHGILPQQLLFNLKKTNLWTRKFSGQGELEWFHFPDCFFVLHPVLLLVKTIIQNLPQNDCKTSKVSSLSDVCGQRSYISNEIFKVYDIHFGPIRRPFNIMSCIHILWSGRRNRSFNTVFISGLGYSLLKIRNPLLYSSVGRTLILQLFNISA